MPVKRIWLAGVRGGKGWSTQSIRKGEYRLFPESREWKNLLEKDTVLSGELWFKRGASEREERRSFQTPREREKKVRKKFTFLFLFFLLSLPFSSLEVSVVLVLLFFRFPNLCRARNRSSVSYRNGFYFICRKSSLRFRLRSLCLARVSNSDLL